MPVLRLPPNVGAIAPRDDPPSPCWPEASRPWPSSSTASASSLSTLSSTSTSSVHTPSSWRSPSTSQATSLLSGGTQPPKDSSPTPSIGIPASSTITSNTTSAPPCTLNEECTNATQVALAISSRSDGNKGAIIGGVIGGLVLLAACAIAGLLLYRRKRRRNKAPSSEFMHSARKGPPPKPAEFSFLPPYTPTPDHVIQSEPRRHSPSPPPPPVPRKSWLIIPGGLTIISAPADRRQSRISGTSSAHCPTSPSPHLLVAQEHDRYDIDELSSEGHDSTAEPDESVVQHDPRPCP
ncbi:hypothetical protein CONPUDRAFT_162603 [Coniophora puteana RWD-64-598 SS2]|uniref:Mid2 domain-containing protein n=1 Tax=Coniophora puteana (strain RWD-64-598) TaxID=741705 RepID=A0A5M3N297_CONPW|nr:uncharacterized protein CONPUDRAFT_162603 [Coniophora puteana RWD-64-598 SS2]EIW85397.1 hypothetical protein CONPUDRAFT_162603 [Coniophora puteana RWD-64-598 SS2]